MTGDTGPATASGVAPDVYEFHIAGTIGPVVRSALPEFSAVLVPRFTVLTGTVPGPRSRGPATPARRARLARRTTCGSPVTRPPPRCHAAIPVAAVNPAAVRRRPERRCCHPRNGRSTLLF